MPYFTERNARIQVTVAGTPLQGQLMAAFSGGDASSSTEYVFPGNMGPGVQVQGAVTPSDITVTANATDSSILWIGPLMNAISNGSGASSVTVTPLDQNKNPIPKSAMTYTGVLKTVTPPSMDSSSSTVAKISIVIAPDEGMSQN